MYIERDWTSSILNKSFSLMFSRNNYPDIMSSLTRGDFALLSGFGKPSQLVCSTVFLTSFFPPRCVSTISISTDLPY